jgi:ATP phosphoribosyltransferase regulatory subunit
MALQPAAGARDLNPREVEQNRAIRTALAEVYGLWGYQEVDPPSFERIDTLEAGGGIDGRELVLLATEDRLGLRPELTASIARAASTRMAERPRPLRLWADGVTFRSSTGDSGHQRIQEQLQSGVELLGARGAAADAELMRLLLAASARLGLHAGHSPRLLIGHQGLLSALLAEVPELQRVEARRAVSELNPLAIDALPLSAAQRSRLQQVMRMRGKPAMVLEALAGWLGSSPLLDELTRILEAVEPAAERGGVTLLLDPTFQPHFDLYDGVVLKLVCQGRHAPVEVASGGRYDGLVGRFSGAGDQAAGVGFGFDLEALREVLGSGPARAAQLPPVLVSFQSDRQLAAAIELLEELHRSGTPAELHGHPVASQAEADQVAAARGAIRATWVAA